MFQLILLLSLSLHYAWGSSKKCELVNCRILCVHLSSLNSSGQNGSKTVRVVLVGGGVHGKVRVGQGKELAIKEEGICVQGPSCTVKEEKECSPVQQQKCETAYEQVIDESGQRFEVLDRSAASRTRKSVWWQKRSSARRCWCPSATLWRRWSAAPGRRRSAMWSRSRSARRSDRGSATRFLNRNALMSLTECATQYRSYISFQSSFCKFLVNIIFIYCKKFFDKPNLLQ